MRAYRSHSRRDLDLSTTEWDDLGEFIDKVKPVIENARNEGTIEAPAPAISSSRYGGDTLFKPGGWVGRYPSDIYVYPDKLTKKEYERLLQEVAGWVELWDLPTAAAVLPMYHAEVDDKRSLILGYSRALQNFTDEMLARRPPVNINRTTEVGTQPRGAIDFQRTIQAQAKQGAKNEVVYDRLEFTFDHPLNLLLIGFHEELEQQLAQLTTQSQTLTAQLRSQQQYHAAFLEEEFGEKLVNRSRDKPLDELVSTSLNKRDIPGHMTELIDLCESYLHHRALSIDFQNQLSLGLKPISKLYELWVLMCILKELREATNQQPELTVEGIHEITVGSAIRLYYNTTVSNHSRFLASELQSHPGRPDFALVIDGSVDWIGDAKYSPLRNIDLQDYQRLLSYAADLMPTEGVSTAAIIHVDRYADPTYIESADYTIAQFSLRPSNPDTTILPESLLESL